MRSTVPLTAAAAVLSGWLMAPTARAQGPAPVPSDAHVSGLLQAVGAQPGADAQPAVAPAALPLELEQAVALALERNLDIAVERLNPSAFDFSLAALRAQFRPSLTSVIGNNNTVQLPTSQLVGGARVVNDQLTYNVGAQQTLPWYGGSYAISFNNRRQDNNNAFVTFNPQINTSVQAQIVQPLLRGFRTDNTRTQLIVTRINRDISEIQLRTTVINTLADVRNAYWDLVFANQVVDVARRSLQLAEKLVEDNKVRVEVGTMAPIDVVQAEAEAATRRQTLAQLEAQALTAELLLKRLIVSGTDDPHWSARLDPTDRPTLTEQPVSLEEALRNALSARTDLSESRRNLDITQANLDLLRNQSLPSANLVANYGLQGIGGTRLLREGTGGPVTESIPGGFSDALRLIRHRDYPTWNVQLQISYPIGANPAAAQYERARIGLQQSQALLRSLELQIAAEVTNARLQVDANVKRVEAARVARELAERRLEAEQSKFDVGLSTNFFVVQAQRDLEDAENSLLRGVLDYQQSLVDFERVQQTSLGRAGISFAGTGTTGGGGAGTTGNVGSGAGGTGGAVGLGGAGGAGGAGGVTGGGGTNVNTGGAGTNTPGVPGTGGGGQ